MSSCQFLASDFNVSFSQSARLVRKKRISVPIFYRHGEVNLGKFVEVCEDGEGDGVDCTDDDNRPTGRGQGRASGFSFGHRQLGYFIHGSKPENVNDHQGHDFWIGRE